MAYQWTAAMSTGVPELDAQHKELFRQVNALSDAMMQRQGAARIAQTLDFLVQYAANHFREEEACMNRHRCPSAAANCTAHQALVQVLTQKKQELASRPITSVDVIELQKLLGQWLIKHIAAIDVNLAKCVGTKAA